MTRKIINAILGLASVDSTFCQELLENPLQAVQARHFELTPEEQEMFRQIAARDLYEFSQILLALLDPSDQSTQKQQES
ncbi:MAG TPA: Os1348 family NHLP clan protein [Ktedonobacteraceae bacterium]|nr:Os1348 family NHLP clan protein [Ktedonobacteraceae bacterium]